MTTEETTKILAILTAAYPNAYRNISAEEASCISMVWAVQFASVPADIVLMALTKAISTCKFPPTVSEVKEKLRTLHWEAYAALNNRCKSPITQGTQKEYRRICEATEKFKCEKLEPSLDDLLIQNSKQFMRVEDMKNDFR